MSFHDDVRKQNLGLDKLSISKKKQVKPVKVVNYNINAAKCNVLTMIVPTRELDHIPGEPHGYLLRSLTPAFWPSVDFSDVAAISNSNIQRTVFYQILLKTESNRQQNII